MQEPSFPAGFPSVKESVGEKSPESEFPLLCDACDGLLPGRGDHEHRSKRNWGDVRGLGRCCDCKYFDGARNHSPSPAASPSATLAGSSNTGLLSTTGTGTSLPSSGVGNGAAGSLNTGVLSATGTGTSLPGSGTGNGVVGSLNTGMFSTAGTGNGSTGVGSSVIGQGPPLSRQAPVVRRRRP